MRLGFPPLFSRFSSVVSHLVRLLVVESYQERHASNLLFRIVSHSRVIEVETYHYRHNQLYVLFYYLSNYPLRAANLIRDDYWSDSVTRVSVKTFRVVLP